jgi:DNA-binding response OmpR family regulator
MKTVLIIEDEPAILNALKDNLEFEGYQVLTASEGDAGLKLAREKRPDLVILDLMLPKISGYEICRELRRNKGAIPILMLTARSEEADRVLGLDLGADDYVIKPFSVRELLARVRALLRRSGNEPELPERLDCAGVQIDFLRYQASKNGAPVELTRKEFAVVRLLASRANVVVSRDELMDKVWGYDAGQTTRTVDNHIAGLRAKLEDEPSRPRLLVTMHGVGYKLVVDA